MCLIIFDWQAESEQQLVLLGNRDEFYQRPSQPAHRWQDIDNIIAGRDLEAGGTWLGFSSGKRFCTVTNYREVPSPSGTHSRGEIPVNFLNSDISAENYARALTQQAGAYTGFNALLFDGEALFYASNRANQPFRRLQSGVYGLSNALLDSPWPKLTRAKFLFKQAQTDLKTDALHDKALLDCMLDQRQPLDTELPETGIGLAGERLLSTIFINSEHYGTRTTSLVRKNSEGIQLTERNFKTSSDTGADQQHFEEHTIFSPI